MKKLSGILLHILIGLSTPSFGQSIDIHQYFDEVENLEVSLITAAPSELVYGTWGHSALRLRSLNGTTGHDLVINYGMFDYETEHFVSKFVRGILPYSLGIELYDDFLVNYLERDQRLTEQVLNLNHEKKKKLLHLINVNLLPENRVYRYDHFKDNCATRIRDLIEACYADELSYSWGNSNEKKYSEETFIDLIEPFVRRKPWLEFGTDILLGYPASQHATYRDRMFLPDNMMKAYEDASIVRGGQRIPLVRDTRIINDGKELPQPSSLSSPMVAFSFILFFIFMLSLVEFRYKRWFWGLDALWLLFMGVIGCLFLFMWIATTHWSTYANLNLIWANPLFLLGILILRGSKARYLGSLLLWVPLAMGFVALTGIQQLAPATYLIGLVHGIRGYRILRFSK